MRSAAVYDMCDAPLMRASTVPPQQDMEMALSASLLPQTSRQRTLAHPISCVGVGLHSGKDVRLTLHPAATGHGVVFRRSDIENSLLIPALYDHVVDTRLSTVIANPEAPSVRIATIEHLMAALHGSGIDNVMIDVDGPEIPILDGSAAEFVFLIQCAGTTEQHEARERIEILNRVRVEGDNGAFAELRPSRRGLALAMSIDFGAKAIGRQSYAMPLSESRFRQDVANCRTFIERRDIQHLQEAGLARGGSLDNAIVVDGATIINPAGLRREGEFVRHKLMDAVGDLYLAGHTLQAGFMGHKSGHCLNNRLLRAVFANKTNWRMINEASARSRLNAA